MFNWNNNVETFRTRRSYTEPSNPEHRQGRRYSQCSGLIILHRQGLVVASWEVFNPMTYKWSVLNLSDCYCKYYQLINGRLLADSALTHTTDSLSLMQTIGSWRWRRSGVSGVNLRAEMKPKSSALSPAHLHAGLPPHLDSVIYKYKDFCGFV